MAEINIDDVPLTLPEAADFMKKSKRTVRGLIKSGLLTANRSGPNGKGRYEILKSECLAYYGREPQNQAVSADGHQQKGNDRWPLNNVTVIGTATMSSRAVTKELGAALTRQTGSKRKNSTIS
jgi:hypothetical protein